MMRSTNDDDPFLQVQTDVLSSLNTARSLFSSYIRIRSLAASPTSPEFLQARTEVEATLQDLSTDLEDLAESVKVIEKDPYGYGLEIEEVARRRRVVEEVGGEVMDMREELAKGFIGSSTDSKREQLPPPSAFEPTSPDATDYAAFEQQRQMEMIHEQDEALDGVFQTVGTLRQQADHMGRELEEQGELLTDVDKLADRVGGRLQTGAAKMKEIIKRNEGVYHDQDALADSESMAVTYEELAELEHEFEDAEMEVQLGERSVREQACQQHRLLEQRYHLISKIPHFWPLVIEQAPPEIDQFIQPSDSQVLATCLRSIEVTRFEIYPYIEKSARQGSPRSVAIEFKFAPNEWFEDEVLRKFFWWRRSRKGWTGLVSDPVRIKWKGKKKDLTEGLTDAAYDAWEAEKKVGEITNGKPRSVKSMLPERKALERKIERSVEGSLSFFTWFAYRGRDVSAEESEKSMLAEQKRREAFREEKRARYESNGPNHKDDSKDNKTDEVEHEEEDDGEENEDESEDDSDEMPSWEAFPGGEDLAVAISEDLFPNAIKYFVQAQEEDSISDAEFEDDTEDSQAEDSGNENESVSGPSKKRSGRDGNDDDEDSDEKEVDIRGLVSKDGNRRPRKRARQPSLP
ncbi:MAG: hypothetical protein M1823_004031 [Watsoniomyces obsoletus]|nr:MAG: hypothetical protein M1823_004031 [Watsoniomyces obsoletus]